MAEITFHDFTQSAISSGSTPEIGRAVERHAIDEREGSNVPDLTENGWTENGQTENGQTGDGWTRKGRTENGRTMDGQIGDGRVGVRGCCGVILQ